MPVVGVRAGEALRRVAAGVVAPDELPGAVAAALRLAPGPIALVLNDLHEIASPQVHGGLVRLVQRLPPTSLLVTTRRDPPWPLAALRLAGLVAEVRAADLAFRADEAAQLFTQMGVGVTESQLERLVERTEGWPAGLRLVAVHLNGVDDPEAAVSAFSGEDHSVAGYLLTEVLDREPPDMIAFLETISGVDLVCADLADALTGRDDGARVLAELASSHLFVQAVGQPGRWYRLHRLISDPAGPSRVAPQAAGPAPARGGVVPQQRHAAGGDALGCRRRALAAGRRAGRDPRPAVHPGRSGPGVRADAGQDPRTVLGVHPELAGALAGARVALGRTPR